ncbi:hypothetical protein DFH09DRAFT_1468518 [Mycena vulgaris]|nr:hypothetical protein DFH09DRAFT_1468518 [Mycena vulgaris]
MSLATLLMRVACAQVQTGECTEYGRRIRYHQRSTRRDHETRSGGVGHQVGRLLERLNLRRKIPKYAHIPSLSSCYLGAFLARFMMPYIMDSPVKDMLHTNAVPSDLECDSIRYFLEGPQKELADLTEEIAHLESLLNQASSKRDRLKLFIDAHLALMSPVRKLPDDIVQTIFEATLPSTRHPTISSDESPLLLCQICQSWRALALTTPRLWARIHVIVPSEPKTQSLTDVVTSWLARSGTVPLEFSVVFSRTSQGSRDISLVVAPLVAVSARWKAIRFELPDNDPTVIIAPVISLSSQDVPLLQTVTFKIIQHAYHTVGNPATSLRLLEAESLRSLTLPSPKWTPPDPGPWAHLSDLTISGHRGDALTYDAALAILSQCTALETCNLAVCSTRITTSKPQHVSLPQLSHLTIENRSIPTAGPHLFSYMSLPTLSSFHCHSLSMFPPTAASMPLESLFPSSTTLASLTVNIPRLRSSVLLAALTTFAYFERADPHFLTQITPGPDTLDPVVCPQLRHLELQGFEAVSDETLLVHIYPSTAPLSLSRVRVTIRRPMQRDIMPDLQDAIAGGLDVVLKYITLPEIVYSPLEGTERHSAQGTVSSRWV